MLFAFLIPDRVNATVRRGRHKSSTNRLLRDRRPIGAQDFLINSPWPRPLPLVGQPMMTDSPLATPTLALQCDHPPLANDVVARPRPVTHAG